MENASKALIIAGSILVSIVIITLGVMIVSNVTGTIQQNSDLTEQEVMTYNQKFLSYEGTKSGTQVRSLCDLIRSHNNTNSDDTSKQIDIVEKETPDENATVGDELITAQKVNTFKQTIKTGKTYIVQFEYDKNSGLIIRACIDPKE